MTAALEHEDAPEQPEAVEEVRTGRLIIVDQAGCERLEASVTDGIIMLRLMDRQQEVRLLLAVTQDGAALVSFPDGEDHEGNMRDTCRIVVSQCEPEIQLRDGIFNDIAIITPKGIRTGSGD